MASIPPYIHFPNYHLHTIPTIFTPTSTRRKTTIVKPSSSAIDPTPKISLIGVDKILDRNQCRCIRIAWLIILSTLSILCGLQVYKSINLFLSNPVIQQTDIVPVSTVDFPAIYLCPGYLRQLQYLFQSNSEVCSDHTLTCLTDDPYEKFMVSAFPPFNASDVEVKDIYNSDKFKFFNIKLYTACDNEDEECKPEGKLLKVNQSHILTFWGSCVILHSVQKVEYRGPFTYLKLHYEDQFRQIVRTALEKQINETSNATLKEEINKSLKRFAVGLLVSVYHKVTLNRYHNLFFDSIEMYHGFEIHTSLHRKEFEIKNRTRRRCVDEETFTDCYNACVEKNFTQLCKSPYSYHSQNRPCYWNKDVIHSTTHNLDAYNTFNLSKCDCLPMCKTILYTASTDVVTRLPSEINIIKFYFRDNTVDKTFEKELYKFKDLLSDFGGHLGLFLGFCSLTAIEIIETALINLAKIFKNYKCKCA